jgi:hypothetical protein
MHSVISHTVFLIIALRMRFVRVPIPIVKPLAVPTAPQSEMDLTEIATPCETQGQAASAPLDNLVLPAPSATLEIQSCNSPRTDISPIWMTLIISCEKQSPNSNTGTHAPSAEADTQNKSTTVSL